MTQWKIELKRVGPERTCGTTVVEAQNLVKAKVHPMRECRKHLPAGHVYLEARGDYTYSIILDIDEVGEVGLTRLGGLPRRNAPPALNPTTSVTRRTWRHPTQSWPRPRFTWEDKT